MIAIPAVDIRDGACVQLVGGSYADERVRLDDPASVAKRWAACGFTRLHVVDLDAATGRGDNAGVVDEIVRDTQVATQVGGGVRTDARVDALRAQGAAGVVVGTRAITDVAWLARVAAAHPGRVIVAADVRDGVVVTHGWSAQTARTLSAYLGDIVDLPLAGVLVTAVHREGLLRGPDLQLMSTAVAASRVPVLASGGIASRDDLVALAECGVAGAVIGMALYAGVLNPQSIAEEFWQ